MLRLSFASLLACAFAQVAAVDFNQEVRPILAQHCFACHGMDDHSRKAKLRLDLPESAHGKGKSGEFAIVAGQPDKSEVVHRIFSDDPDDVMPPPETKKPMSAKDKATSVPGSPKAANISRTGPSPHPSRHPCRRTASILSMRLCALASTRPA